MSNGQSSETGGEKHKTIIISVDPAEKSSRQAQ